MAGKDVKHYSGDPDTREGYYRKDTDGQTIRYQTEWKKMKGPAKGFGESLYQIHHIIPETSIYNKMVYKISSATKREYMLKCMWISPWNINEKGNLIGLPDLYTFLIYFDKKQNDEKGTDQGKSLLRGTSWSYVKGKMKAFENVYKGAKRLALFDLAANPETFPVHLPVSWGHTKYNKNVANDLKTEVADTLSEVMKDHTVDPANIAKAFVDIANRRRAYLLTRAMNATYDTWKKQYDRPKVAEDTWRKPFTMDKASSPIT